MAPRGDVSAAAPVRPAIDATPTVGHADPGGADVGVRVADVPRPGGGVPGHDRLALCLRQRPQQIEAEIEQAGVARRQSLQGFGRDAYSQAGEHQDPP